MAFKFLAVRANTTTALAAFTPGTTKLKWLAAFGWEIYSCGGTVFDAMTDAQIKEYDFIGLSYRWQASGTNSADMARINRMKAIPVPWTIPGWAIGATSTEYANAAVVNNQLATVGLTSGSSRGARQYAAYGAPGVNNRTPSSMFAKVLRSAPAQNTSVGSDSAPGNFVTFDDVLGDQTLISGGDLSGGTRYTMGSLIEKGTVAAGTPLAARAYLSPWDWYTDPPNGESSGGFFVSQSMLMSMMWAMGGAEIGFGPPVPSSGLIFPRPR